MSAKKDALEVFHELGVHLPTRTISLDTSYEEDGDQDGVNHFMTTSFIKNLHTLEHINKDPITILLNTHGGSPPEGMAIYTAIKNSKCHITIKVTGQACSMGSVILQAADERVATPWSPIMCHTGLGCVGDANPYEVARSAEFDLKYGERIDLVIWNRINAKRDSEQPPQAHMSKDAFLTRMLKGMYLFPEEALALGLIDRIEGEM